MKVVFILSIILIGFRIQTLGCTCFETSHPCEEFNRRRTVFTGHVIEDRKVPLSEKEETVLKVIVDEEFRGVKKGQIINVAKSGVCNETLSVGINYLVYADKVENDLYNIFMCSRTRPLSNASADLAFLRNLDKINQTSVFGKALAYFKRKDNEAGILRMIPDVQVKVFNETHSFQARTDKGGHYHIDDIPPGKYQVEAILPEG
jgi:hypothetical protein